MYRGICLPRLPENWSVPSSNKAVWSRKSEWKLEWLVSDGLYGKLGLCFEGSCSQLGLFEITSDRSLKILSRLSIDLEIRLLSMGACVLRKGGLIVLQCKCGLLSWLRFSIPAMYCLSGARKDWKRRLGLSYGWCCWAGELIWENSLTKDWTAIKI